MERSGRAAGKEDRMKTVYICSPYRGTTEEVARNVALAKRLCRKAALEGNLVLCPHLFYPRFFAG